MSRQAEDGALAAPARSHRTVTSVDVARLAGVSRATVSHILDDRWPSPAPATRLPWPWCSPPGISAAL